MWDAHDIVIVIAIVIVIVRVRVIVIVPVEPGVVHPPARSTPGTLHSNIACKITGCTGLDVFVLHVWFGCCDR